MAIFYKDWEMINKNILFNFLFYRRENMMKKLFIFIVIIAVFALIIGFIAYNNNNSTSQNQGGTRLSTNVNEENAENRIANILESQSQVTETEISSFQTKILDDTPGRLNNISITCSTLNNTIVKAGETFSFNETVGKPSSERGYQEAKIIVDHKAELGIGGGNCQVSSTLYDAVLNVPSLVVVERHEHGKSVGYVPLGKDATVSYGTFDLKFRNDTGRDVRIDATTDNQTVTIRLIQL